MPSRTASERIEAQDVKVGDFIALFGNEVEVTAVAKPDGHARVRMDLANGRYLVLDMFAPVQRCIR